MANLTQYTLLYKNNRYDYIVFKTSGIFGISDITENTHKITNDSYRSYSTYRHDLTCDTSLVKINETNYLTPFILNNYYNKEVNYEFSGIVLNKDFATNGNEVSLEDLFCEFGYDYLYAVTVNSSSVDSSKYKYFDIDSSEVEGRWEILPIGNYIYETVEDDTGKEVTVKTPILYDGTYVPTAQEILDGSLYIVLKSGNYINKVYFNNNYLPSIFINDDKLPTPEKNEINVSIYNYFNKVDDYVINSRQPLKLCDVKLYQKVPVAIKWDNLFNITNLNNIIDYLTTTATGPKLSKNDFHITCHTHIIYRLINEDGSSSSDNTNYLVYGEMKDYMATETVKDSNCQFNDFSSGPIYREGENGDKIYVQVVIAFTITLTGYEEYKS